MIIMGTLNLPIFQYQFPRLGRSKPLSQLSEKTVSSAVRRALRNNFQQVQVVCAVQYQNGAWQGNALINGTIYSYTVN